MERIHCNIEYNSSEDQGYPLCEVLYNNSVIKKFVADSNNIEFWFDSKNDFFKFTIRHYGKDMKKHTKRFIEIKKIYFNDVDIKNLIWKTTQQPILPSWQNYKDYNWESNLYMGHNGDLNWNFKSPIMKFLLDYHQSNRKVDHGLQQNNVNLLDEMINYFEKIIKNKKNTNL